MREIGALVVLYLAAQLIDVKSGEGGFLTALGLIVSVGALIFFTAALAERFYSNMNEWFRITPGMPQFYDDYEDDDVESDDK